MAEIHVFGGRIYAADGSGILVTRNELALLTDDDVAAITQAAVVGPQSYEDSGSLTMTPDGRLRVDTEPTAETVNLFAGPNPWSGSPWSSKSAW